MKNEAMNPLGPTFRRRLAAALLLPLLLSTSVTASDTAPAARTIRPFDSDWRFSQADDASASQTAYDDASWRTVDVPHDWGVEGTVSETAPTGRGGGYRPSGVSWYRKHFSLPDDEKDRRVFVVFDGVMANADVWINGHRLGLRPSGYVRFARELVATNRVSDATFVKFGDNATNVLAVLTDTTVQPASRWYSGEGIYRHVRLVLTGQVRVARGGLYVTTPEIRPDHAIAQARATVVNGGDHPQSLSVRFSVTEAGGREVAAGSTDARSVGIGETADFAAELRIASPQLWDIGAGRIYRITARVVAGSDVVDDDSVNFGIRDAHFEAATGFWLNGRNIKLKGVCLHQNGGAVGAAVPVRVWQRRLERLRSLGVNAIRTAHNPPDPAFLDLCDRMGFLVMDEFFDAWTVGKPGAERGYNLIFPEWGLRDERDTILRDRNHPSIILWSTGNEIHDTPNAVLSKNILAKLVGLAHTEDPSRPVTQALLRPNRSHDYDDGLADMLDVIGTNYRDNELLAAHAAKPSRKIVGTEQRQDRETWLAARDNPPHAGQFLWAGIDYLGEAPWPLISSPSGLLDRTGRIKARAYERQSWWSETPMVHITRHEPALNPPGRRRWPGLDLTSDWTPVDPATYHGADIEVFSNCDEVELFLNGRSLGTQQKPADASPFVWKVAYEPGTIRAVGRNAGREVATHELKTAGAPARLVLTVGHDTLAATWDDAATITVAAVDSNGVPCPWADSDVHFDLAGPGRIVAVDNGNLVDHAPFQAADRKLFHGECIAIVRATDTSGPLKLTATAPGLGAGEISITTTGAQ